MIFECAFICPEVLTVVDGPGYYPGHESSIYEIIKNYGFLLLLVHK